MTTTAAAAIARPPTRERPYALIEPEQPTQLDALDHAWLLECYKTHGALLLRGFDADLDAFRRFSDPFCKTWVVNEAGGRDELDRVHHIQSVNRGVRAFPLHSEISRSPWRPDICFFHCVVPPQHGGETTLCDGSEVVRALPAALRAILSTLTLRYESRALPKELAMWLGTETPDAPLLADPPADCPFRFSADTDGIRRWFTRPMLNKPLFSDARAFANFLFFARDGHDSRGFPLLGDRSVISDALVDTLRAACDALTAEIAWRANDTLVVDNSRFMHGRRTIADAAERLIATRFGYLWDAPQIPEEPAEPIWRRQDFAPI